MDKYGVWGMNLGDLPRLSNARTRSISAESFTGEKGKGGAATEGTGLQCGEVAQKSSWRGIKNGEK